MEWLILVICAYLLGSVPFGYIVGRMNGIDIRQHGSGNVGFTNVWRTLGFKIGAVVLAFDLGKGWVSACLGFHLAGEYGAIVGGIMAILGHTWSCFLHFKGGKGVATGAGVLLYLSPLTFAICACILVAFCLITKYMSLGSIFASLSAPVVMYFLNAPTVYNVTILIAAVYIVYLHRGNIKRLLNGTENKLGHKKK